MTVTPPEDQRISRLIDANLDRAREGLRVIEDWCRFGIENKLIVSKLKDWRQQLGSHHLEIYKKTRSTSNDKGAGLGHPKQKERNTPTKIIEANSSRVQEALRVIEEFARSSNEPLAKISAKIRYELYDLEILIIKTIEKEQRNQKLQTSRVCLITTPKEELNEIVLSALKAGIGMIQYRSKGTSDLMKINQGRKIASLCKRFNALFIINDRVDLAMALNADGVHLGQDDMPTNIARELIGFDKVIGRSTHSLEQVKKAEKESCDYIGIGPIFQSNSKPSAKYLGVNLLREVSKRTNLPLFAIGGITRSNIGEITSAGIKRIAVINAIMNAKDPSMESLMLLKQLKCELK